MAPPRLLFATRNPGKLTELRALTFDLILDVQGIPDLAMVIPEVKEDGATYEENALKKARTVCAATRLPSLADDSGLEVDALSGEPGVRSARYAGEDASDDDNNRKVINRLRLLGIPPEQRTARFRCTLAFVDPAGRSFVSEGSCEGLIVDPPRGKHGFGYDPIFFSPELGQTFGEASIGQKAKNSHRGAAMKQMKETLISYFKLARPGTQR